MVFCCDIELNYVEDKLLSPVDIFDTNGVVCGGSRKLAEKLG